MTSGDITCQLGLTALTSYCSDWAISSPNRVPGERFVFSRKAVAGPCFAMLLTAAALPQGSRTLSTCMFTGVSQVIGSCGRLFHQTPKMTLRSASSEVGGTWRSGSPPEAVWFGEMTDQGYPNAPIQLQIYSHGAGILQTIYGWFPVTEYRSTSSGITFELDGEHEVSPNALDAHILRRAAEILSSSSVWNRTDNRRCAPDATQWSIYCAGVRALEEVTGGTGGGHGIDHRRPALEVLRGVVEDRSKGRHYHHDLMDYNNDPTTTLADVESLFREAFEKMSDSSWLAAHGFE